MNRKGQAAIEYMAVFGIALLLSLPFVIRAQTTIADLQTGSSVMELQNSLQEIESAIDMVSASGEPARRTFDVSIPENVVEGKIVNDSIVYTVRTRSGETDLIRSFDINVTGSLPVDSGRHRVTVYAEDNGAVVEVVE